MQLEGVDLVVDVALDGAAAVEMAKTVAYSVILMDMQMPNISGLDATRQIRMISGYQKTPIIALTANVFNEDKLLCLEAGMNSFLPKPVDPEFLFATLLRSLSQLNA
jgi:CheY-like chemotaxis protein